MLTLHVLPDGVHRIRHYGFLANGHRHQKLDLCRSLLAVSHQQDVTANQDAAPEANIPGNRCPCCGGQMVTLAIWRYRDTARFAFWNDSS